MNKETALLSRILWWKVVWQDRKVNCYKQILLVYYHGCSTVSWYRPFFFLLSETCLGLFSQLANNATFRQFMLFPGLNPFQTLLSEWIYSIWQLALTMNISMLNGRGESVGFSLGPFDLVLDPESHLDSDLTHLWYVVTCLGLHLVSTTALILPRVSELLNVINLEKCS